MGLLGSQVYATRSYYVTTRWRKRYFVITDDGRLQWWKTHKKDNYEKPAGTRYPARVEISVSRRRRSPFALIRAALDCGPPPPFQRGRSKRVDFERLAGISRRRKDRERSSG